MKLSKKAHEIHSRINKEDTKMGDLRKIAKAIKKDHELAMELWQAGGFFPRQLAILIMDKKQITREFIDQVDNDIKQHKAFERNYLTDWFMANQLAKDKKTVAMMESWENSPSVMKRRIFWYYQGRLRWTGKNPSDNTEELLLAIEKKMANEKPEVQWAMNLTAGWIGIYEPDQRSRCISLGEKLGLYKNETVSKGCTPSYLPDFIRIEVEKRNT